MKKSLSQQEQKELVGFFAIDALITHEKIFSGMKIGLGTGSTAIPAVRRLAQRIADGTLSEIRAVPTSFQTAIECENLGIPIFSLNSKEIGGFLDLTIDGADEITPEKSLIKGGGAALLLEKIIAYNSQHFVIVADESKLVPHLGTGFALPVEIIAEARIAVIRHIEELGGTCVLRQGVRKAGPVITDNGNMILDVLWKTPQDAAVLETALNVIIGVVENGFFTENMPTVFAARADGTVSEF